MRPGDRLTFRQLAEDHTVFAPDAFAGVIGQRVPLTMAGERIGTALLLAAEVAEDGRSVSLTVQVSTPEKSP
jgi:hypothetical protein